MSKEIILYIAIALILFIAIILFFFLSIEYNDNLVEEMINYCGSYYIKSNSERIEIYTKKGQIRVSASNKISNKRKELLYFYRSPGIEQHFKKYLISNGLMDEENSIFFRNKKKAFRSFLKFYNEYKKSLKNNHDRFISVEDFYLVKKESKGDFVGIYIIHNIDKNMFYVGQAKRVFFRVSQHFTGHGNGDVYADYKYGDAFEIKLVKLNNSQFDNLDTMEMYYIDLYDASIYGYNKTKGNEL